MVLVWLLMSVICDTATGAYIIPGGVVVVLIFVFVHHVILFKLVVVVLSNSSASVVEADNAVLDDCYNLWYKVLIRYMEKT